MQWFFIKDGKRQGPYNDTEFQEWIIHGDIQPATLVWNPNLSDWTPFEKISHPGSTPSGQTAGNAYPCVECAGLFSLDELIPFGTHFVCARCKPLFFARFRQGINPEPSTPYASFWLRWGAKIIDLVITGAFQMSIMLLLLSFMDEQETFFGMIISMFTGLVGLFCLLAYNTYFIGRFGATPGKMACGIKVVLADGGPISYLRALGRAAGELVSSTIMNIGYLMMIFDAQKRTLHDLFCDTRVIRIQDVDYGH